MRERTFAAVLILHAAIILILTAVPAPAQENGDLKINLVVSDQRILIYAGAQKGLEVGQKYSIVRAGATIGVLEITEVQKTFSVAKVVEKSENPQDMDVLVPAGAAPPAKKAEIKEEKASKKEVKKETAEEEKTEEKKTEEKKEEKTESKTTSRRRSSKVDDTESAEDKPAEKKTEEKTAEKKESSSRSSRRGSSRGDDSTVEKKTEETKPAAEEKKEEKKTAKQAGKTEKKDPREMSFPIEGGLSGLWTIPTVDVLEKGTFAASFYYDDYSSGYNSLYYLDEYYMETTEFDGGWRDTQKDSISVGYGLGKGLEIGVSEVRLRVSEYDQHDQGEVRTTGTSKGHTISVKFNPNKQFLLNETTNKKWSVALAAERCEIGNADSTKFYAVAHFPFDKFDFHAGVYHSNMERSRGKRTGSLAGVELTITPSFLFIGEAKLFQGDYTWNYGIRYIYRDRGSALLGISDANDLKYKSLGLSYKF